MHGVVLSALLDNLGTGHHCGSLLGTREMYCPLAPKPAAEGKEAENILENFRVRKCVY